MPVHSHATSLSLFVDAKAYARTSTDKEASNSIDTTTQPRYDLVCAAIMHDQGIHERLLLRRRQDALFYSALGAQPVAMHKLFLAGG